MAYRILDRDVRLPATPAQLDARFDENDGWEMLDAERGALTALLGELRPETAIEVGTYRGGSLAVLARFSKKVYSLDIDLTFRDQRGSAYPNVQFVPGYSQNTLPRLIADVRARGEKLGFVLIDADHSEDAVRTDINNVLEYRPESPLYLIIHDSFNPGCRRGILSADWARNPHVHLVEVDYVTGRLFAAEGPGRGRSMWCGFALAVLLPEPRKGPPVLSQNDALMYQAAYKRSGHAHDKSWNPRHWGQRGLSKLRRKGRAVAAGSLKTLAPGLYSRLKH